MSELNDMMGGADDVAVSEAAALIGRVTDASSDYGSVAGEVAADLGL